MSEVRIARFVDMQACKSIFSDTSTFVLRSSEYYMREHETSRGDERELEVSLSDGGSASSQGVVLSCWSLLDEGTSILDEWDIFPDSVVAIISTPSRVCTFLESAFEIEFRTMRDRRRFPFIFIEHKPVTYADEVAEEITPDNIMDITVFTKRLRFAKQKEYRFALPYSMVPHVIDTYTFAKTPGDYIEECFANPKMSKEDKEMLRLILLQAMAGYGYFCDKKMCEIIANANILF